MSDIQWQQLKVFSDVPSAHAMAARLKAEGLTVRIVSDAVVLGQAAPSRLMIDRLQWRRAQLLLAENTFSDGELLFLSTGERTDDGESAP